MDTRMPKIPEPEKTTAKQIHWLYQEKKEDPRPHMGCSIIGHSCDRYIWLTWRWALAEKFPGRIKRVFDTGKREEVRLCEDLRGLGIELYTMDQESGKQIAVHAHDGHFSGSVDGIARGFVEAPKSWAVLECKTHNTKSFTELQKKGMRESKKQHYAQMQMYMGLLEIDRGMYLAQCKDDDNIYSEWVHFDKDVFNGYLDRAARLIENTSVPAKLSEDPSWYECKWCDFSDLCHGEQIAQPNCRTCCHITPEKDARWLCEVTGKDRSFKEQLLGCDHHLYIPPLVPFAEPIDGTGNHIVYRKADGTEFTNGSVPGQFKSRELFSIDPALIGNQTIQDIKEIFGAEVTRSMADMKDDLEAVYSDDKTVAGKKMKEQIKANKAAVNYLKASGRT